jgi:hypothetical protein
MNPLRDSCTVHLVLNPALRSDLGTHETTDTYDLPPLRRPFYTY